MDGPTCQWRKSEGVWREAAMQGSSLLLSAAFKALTLPLGAFVFCTGTSVSLLLKDCIQIAELMHVHHRDKEHYSHSGSCVRTVPTIFYGWRPTLFLSQRASLSVHRAILSSSSDSSCSSTSSRSSPLCLSFSFRSVLELSEWERGNACILVFVGVAKLWPSWPGFTLLEQSCAVLPVIWNWLKMTDRSGNAKRQTFEMDLIEYTVLKTLKNETKTLPTFFYFRFYNCAQTYRQTLCCPEPFSILWL